MKRQLSVVALIGLLGLLKRQIRINGGEGVETLTNTVNSVEAGFGHLHRRKFAASVGLRQFHNGQFDDVVIHANPAHQGIAPSSRKKRKPAAKKARFRPGAWVLLETGVGAAEPALELLLRAEFLCDAELRRDLAGQPRYLLAKVREKA